MAQESPENAPPAYLKTTTKTAIAAQHSPRLPRCAPELSHIQNKAAPLRATSPIRSR
jgi:hypothetical protein